MLTFKSLINIVFFIITWATQSFIEYALSLDILDEKELEFDYANLFPMLQGQEHSTIHNTVLQPYSSKARKPHLFSKVIAATFFSADVHSDAGMLQAMDSDTEKTLKKKKF